jgi:hypothetical protein
VSVLDHAALPSWILRFLDEPDAALDQILRGAVFLGASGAAEPGDLLIDWIDRYADDLDIGDVFDERLAAWLEIHWDAPDNDDGDEIVAADAWVRALNAVGYLEELQQSAEVLRARFDDRGWEPAWLTRWMSAGPKVNEPPADTVRAASAWTRRSSSGWSITRAPARG